MVFAKNLLVLLLLLPIFGSACYADEYLKVTIAEPYIELHTGPGVGYPVFYIAERGESVSVLKQRTDWYKVRNHKGKEGWVSIDQMGKTIGPDGQPLNVAYPDFKAYTKRKWEGGFMSGSFGGADDISAYMAYHFTANISGEVEIGQFFGNFSDGTYGTLNLVQQPFPEWRLSPFFTLGVGRLKTDPKATLVATQDRNDEMIDVGVGLRYYLTRRFLVRVQYKSYIVFTNREQNDNIEEWKIGLSAFF